MILCWMFYMKNLELWDNRECREERKHMEYCLFRHGQTNWNVNGIIKSHMDDSGTHFTEAGQEQIEYITELLKNTGIQAVFASDLYRTTETANYINAYLKVPVFFSERLRGMDMGAFLGKPIEEFLQHEEVRKAFVDYDSPIPGGESINQLVERLCGALKGIRDNYSYTRVLVITHGAAISNIVAYVNHTPYREFDYCYLRLEEDTFSVVETGRYDELLAGQGPS